MTADEFVPYLWTVFFFVLFNNLAGYDSGWGVGHRKHQRDVHPGLDHLRRGSLRGDERRWVRSDSGSGIVPKLDVPPLIKPPLWALLFVIEVAGLLIRHFVLCVRLFANMMAGHLVLAVIFSFILLVGRVGLQYVVTPVSIARFGGPELAGSFRGLLAGVHFHVPVRAVHRIRPLIRIDPQRPGIADSRLQ